MGGVGRRSNLVWDELIPKGIELKFSKQCVSQIG